MTWANKVGFFLIPVIIVFTTMAYGTVHQPILSAFYILVTIPVLLWAIDAYSSGAIRFSSNHIQLALLAAAVYGAIQVIPFGTLADTAGVTGIPRTISLDPFAT